MKLTAEWLVEQLDSLRSRLHQLGFSDWIIDKTIDRVITSALTHLHADDVSNREAWLSSSALKAARQLLFKELRLSSIEALSPVLQVNPLIDEQEKHELLWNAFDKLTDKQQQAIELCVMNELTLTEAGTIMKRTRANVMKFKKAGIKKLKKLLEDSNVRRT